MITQLFKVDFLATECRLSNLNILRAACRGMQPKNCLVDIEKPYICDPGEKGGDA